MAALEKIQLETLNGAAYQQILSALRNGAFKPGHGLTTRSVASELGVSATPVREALGRLVAQNALELDPKTRAACVPRITPDFLEELYEIRLMLDVTAARAAAKSATEEELLKIADLADELDILEPEIDAPTFRLKSEQFFFSVYAAAKKPILYAMLDALWIRSSVILGLIAKQRPQDFTIMQERRALVEALFARDPQAAADAISGTLVRTRDMLLGLINDVPQTEI